MKELCPSAGADFRPDFRARRRPDRRRSDPRGVGADGGGTRCTPLAIQVARMSNPAGRGDAGERRRRLEEFMPKGPSDNAFLQQRIPMRQVRASEAGRPA